ncbi:MAG: hypothetical protein NUW21_13490 [Elusimicrobia bacterium]|nr:hypothetical protein [Elusimicrobiota bacterium]
MNKTRCGSRFISRLLLGTLLCARAGPLRAQPVISPAFQGASGSIGMTAGAHLMMFSASQVAASVITSGAHTVHSGFFGFWAGSPLVATALSGQATLLSIMTPGGLATASLPADSVAAGTVVTIQLPGSTPPPGAILAAVSGTGFELDPSYHPSAPASLSLSYASADLAGQDPEGLVIARYDALSGFWVALASSVDEGGRVVTAQTGDFGAFQLMGAAPAAAAVPTAKAFPNPLRPSRGHRAMTFTGLPADARLRIYTLKGALVQDLSADAAGRSSWDGRNRSGAQAASGVYFALAQGVGRSAKITVAIER